MYDVPRNQHLFGEGALGAAGVTFRFRHVKLKVMQHVPRYILAFVLVGSFIYLANSLFVGPLTPLDVAVIVVAVLATSFIGYYLLVRRPKTNRNMLAALVSIISKGDVEALTALERTLQRNPDFKPLVSELRAQWLDRQAELGSAVEKQRVAELQGKVLNSLIMGFCQEIPISLNSMLGALALIEGGVLSKKQKYFLGTAETSSEAIHSTLENVKDLLLSQDGKIQINERPFSLRQLLREVADQWSDRFESKQQTLMLMTTDDVPDALLSDSPRLRQILEHFLSNALKYGDAGEVVLSTEQTEGCSTKAACLRIEVTNSGSYQPLGQENILRSGPSTQDDDFTTNLEKGQFGLAICSAVARAMGGTVGANNSDPSETVFWLELPIKLHHWRINPEPAVDEDVEQAKLLTRAGIRPLILVAEDVYTNQIVIEAYLSEFGCDVHMVEDGQEAVQAVQQHKFDVILMDICMPKMDGIAATKAIRALGSLYCDIPMVALSANAMPEHLSEQFNAGLDAVLAKPFKQNQLYQTLKQSLLDEKERPDAEEGPTVLHGTSSSTTIAGVSTGCTDP